MSKRDYYEILEVSKNASKDEIKKAYRKMAIKHHPDKNPNDKSAEEKFKEAAEAYEVLSNDDKKRRYDQFGHAGVGGASGGSGGYGGGMSMDDIFSNFGDIFGDVFGGGFGGFGGRGRQSRRVNKGTNLRVKVKLNLNEIATGVEKKIKVKKYVSCKTCDGSGAVPGSKHTECSTCHGQGQVITVTNTILGQMQSARTCPTCGGEGKIITQKCTSCYGEGIMQDEEVVNIKIPAGVGEGMQLSVSGKGNAARRGGMNGDLLVLIEEEKHEELIRDDNDLLYNLFISIPDVTLGATVEIPTLEGKVKIKIDPGTQPGRILRLRGKGLTDVNAYRKGDLLVKVNVWIPSAISKEEKKIFEKLQSSPSFIPNPSSSEKSFFEKMKEYF
ncbi:MAG TPA: molecular chaperone DnaJ [Bacteroidales bacterium]|nr:MAG: molecular chaperone DnaJ [Bacteroidetes bacterium GWF2_33_38]OFY76245.1 MAG: molecular chaperone DnaJ [Bacteroidetes bacterium RIFOXYA12_FULL_33_9]OFY84994.1 MAG: molecular chaperone DnaJ [Bacteroidetes bacterium RIFOXYA2_FULL_33_7]HBF87417.1 molecular chaperone DnaJ [Bacteroidales bacterium]